MSRNARGRFEGASEDNSAVTASRALIIQIMELESRRNFLREHAIRFTEIMQAELTDVPREADKEVQLRAEIQYYTDALTRFKTENTTLEQGIDLVLAPKIGLDTEGISRTLGARFAQLTPSAGEPFVQLQEDGITLYWKNNLDNGASRFAAALHQHGMTAATQTQALPDQYVPNFMSELEPEQRYQGSTAQCVRITHSQVDHLLALAQFHPYLCKAVVSDWYRARDLDRASLLTQELLIQRQSPTDTAPLSFVSATRMPLPGQEDLVQIVVAASEEEQRAEHRHHMVILLDDSISMDNGSMVAANSALRKFLENLPSNSMVSIQPFNAKTLCYRMPIDTLRQNLAAYCSTRANGGTPLTEIMTNSAVFLRAHPEDYLISEEELNHTTIALLTDGQLNGSFESTLVAMQTSKNAHLLGSIDTTTIPGLRLENFISYGLDHLQARQMPVCLPISIGQGSDETFMRQLAHAFGAPEVFIKTDADQEKDSDAAMDILSQMRSRVPRAFVGLGYCSAEGAQAAVGQEESNIFCGRTRTIYVRIPSNASNLQFCVNDDLRTVYHDRVIETDIDSRPDMLNDYLRQQLHHIRMTFSAQAAAMTTHATSYSQGGRRGGTVEAPVQTVPVTATLEEFERLKSRTIEKVQYLLATCRDSALSAEMTLLIANLQGTDPQTLLAQVSPNRSIIAQFTQQRCLGEKAPTVSRDRPQAIDSVIEDIRSDQLQNARCALIQSPELLNQSSRDQYRATPLLTALALERSSAFVQALLQIAPTTLNLLAVDSSGNTALHRAIWNGDVDTSVLLIEQLKAKNQLTLILTMRNANTVGATLGETVLDNLLRTEKLNQAQKNALRRALEVELDAEFDLGALEALEGAMFNQHLTETWNTPLMEVMCGLKATTVTNRPSTRQYIVRVLNRIRQEGIYFDLTASNFKGDTLLHFAIGYGELGLAREILNLAIETHQIQGVLAARNNYAMTTVQTAVAAVDTGGEVPYMNLAAIGHQKFAEFPQQIEAIMPLILKNIALSPQILEPVPGKSLIEVVLQRMAALSAWELGVVNEPSSARIEILQQQALIARALDSYTQLSDWHTCVQTLNPQLTGPQQAEFGHLLQLYGKQLEGYGTMTFLEASPIHQLRVLITECTEKVSAPFLQKLKNIQMHADTMMIDDALSSIPQSQSSSFLSLSSTTTATSDDLYRRIRGCLVQYRAYRIGELSTLEQQYAQLLAPTRNAEEATENEMEFDAAFVI